MFLEDVAAAVLDIRKQWFPSTVKIDPQRDTETVLQFRSRAASAPTRGGQHRRSRWRDEQQPRHESIGRDRASEMGIHVITQDNANHPEQRNYASHVAAGHMQRTMADDSPCFGVSGRFLVLSRDKVPQGRSLPVDGLEAGYVWDALSMARMESPNT